MNIEVGKTYVTLGGEIATVVEECPTSWFSPFSARIDGNLYAYKASGAHTMGNAMLDLVAEANFLPGKKYRTRGGASGSDTGVRGVTRVVTPEAFPGVSEEYYGGRWVEVRGVYRNGDEFHDGFRNITTGQAPSGAIHTVYLVPGAIEDQPPAKAPQIMHHDLMLAALGGRVIQWRRESSQWVDCTDARSAVRCLVSGDDSFEYRVKPESIVSWHQVFRGGKIGEGWIERADVEGPNAFKVLRIELDPDTLDVIEARTEAP